MTTAIGGHQSHPPTPTVDQAQGPRRCAQARDVDHQMSVCRATTHQWTTASHRNDDRCQRGGGAPRAPPNHTVNQAQRLWHCTQACDAYRQTPACCDPPAAKTLTPRRLEGTSSTPHCHHPHAQARDADHNCETPCRPTDSQCTATTIASSTVHDGNRV